MKRADDAYDCLVVGGGPAGAATALALTALDRRVLLVEAATAVEPRVRIGETLPGSIRIPLGQLGVWDRFLSSGPHPAASVRSVWGGATARESAALCDPHGPGWHIDRPTFERLLLTAARAAGADVRWGSRPAGKIRRVDRGFCVRVRDGDSVGEITARTVVDATGRKAMIARQLGARRRVCDRLVAVVAFVDLSAPAARDSATLIEADQTGWWYSAPLPTGRAVLAYMTDSDVCRRHRGAAPGLFRSALDRCPLTQARGGPPATTAAVRVWAAGSAELVPAAGPGWAAVGDAAAARDPLSSGGIYEALWSGQAAARALAAAGAREEQLDAYAHEISARFDRYLQKRSRNYAREQRWRTSVFWQRRHAPGGAALV